VIKKRILVVSNSPQIIQGSGGRTRIVYEIKEIIAPTVETRLFCFVNLKYYFQYKKLIKAKKQLEIDTGVKVIYSPSLPTFHGLLDNLVNFINCISIFVYSLFWKCNSYYAQGISAAFPIILLKKTILPIKLITDVHGVLPEEHFYKNSSFNDLEFQKLGLKEKQVLECSDLIFLVSNRLFEHYKLKYSLNLSNSLVVPCLTNYQSESPPLNSTCTPSLLNDINNDRLIFTYVGSFRQYQLVDQTFETFLKIKSKIQNAYFLIITNHVSNFENKAREQNISDSDYKIVSINQNEVQNYLHYTDIGFLLRDNSIVNKVASPTKFAEYLMAGVPVITTNFVGDYSSIVKTKRIGYVIENLEILDDNLFLFINEYINNKQEYKKRAFNFANDNLTWDSYKLLIPEYLRKYEII